MDFKALNDRVRQAGGDVVIDDCYGQRYIASGLSGRSITINGTPGNALGAYLDGAAVTVNGNAQDAVGDTMNDGRIVVHGSAGDALGYAMRGGKIFVKGNSGYRTGIHMKQYKDKRPVIVVGGSAGSFLGEYLAGGLIIVLGIGARDGRVVGNFPGTGMHGGSIFLRTGTPPPHLPAQLYAAPATPEDLEIAAPHIEEFAGYFGYDAKELLGGKYCVLRPNSRNPYHRMYTAN